MLPQGKDNTSALLAFSTAEDGMKVTGILRGCLHFDQNVIATHNSPSPNQKPPGLPIGAE